MADKLDDAHVPWRELLTGDHALALMLVSLGVWLHAADSLLVATMLPSIVAEIGGAALVSWTVALYEIGSIVAGASAALLTMRFGLRRPMAAAALLFAFGCAVSAVAPTMPVVLAGRLLQGLGGGGLMAMAFVAVTMLFTPRLTPRVLAVVSALWGISAFLGPLIGAVFVEYATWRWGFWFFALQAVALSALVGFAGPSGARVSGADLGRLPLARLSVLAAGVVLIAYGGVDVAAGRTGMLVVAGLTCLAVFLWLDARSGTRRMLPARPLATTTRAGSALATVIAFSIATIAVTAYGPLLVTAIHDASALTAGYIVACASIGWSVAAIIVSGSPERHDGRFIALGMACVTLSIAGFAWSVPNGPVWLVAVCAALEGVGFGTAWTFILRRATAGATEEEARRISGAIPTVQRLGYALGAAYVGIVANAAGFADAQGAADMAFVARILFLACLPFAAFGLFAMTGMMRNLRPKSIP